MEKCKLCPFGNSSAYRSVSTPATDDMMVFSDRENLDGDAGVDLLKEAIDSLQSLEKKVDILWECEKERMQELGGWSEPGEDK